MENNFWSITSYGTKINVNKSSISQADGKVDVIVVGYNQQQMLADSGNNLALSVGTCFYNQKHGMWIKDKEDDNDDKNKLFIHPTRRVVFSQNINEKSDKNFYATTCTKPLNIIEPYVRFDIVDSLLKYTVERLRPDQYCENKTFNILFFCNEKAIQEAIKDLSLCYINILERIVLDLSKKKQKNIALPTLSTEVGLPRSKAARIAIKTILEFVKNNIKV